MLTLLALNLVCKIVIMPELVPKKRRRQSGTDAQHVTWGYTQGWTFCLSLSFYFLQWQKCWMKTLIVVFVCVWWAANIQIWQNPVTVRYYHLIRSVPVQKVDFRHVFPVLYTDDGVCVTPADNGCPQHIYRQTYTHATHIVLQSLFMDHFVWIVLHHAKSKLNTNWWQCINYTMSLKTDILK